MSTCVLSIDQGTTSSRAIVFDSNGVGLHTAQREFTQYFPEDGWVEHDPEEIWTTTLEVTRAALDAARAQGLEVAGIGITNQRETTVVWNRRTGEAIHRAIVWQDRRTAAHCERLRGDGHEVAVRARTGLLLDPYFSATKVGWILDHVDGARALAERGELAFGTVDAFLIWRLTGGRVHATDATNASRTLLFNIHTQAWDPELTSLFGVPLAMLPEVRDCAGDFGICDEGLLGTPLPIAGVAGDQQAALVGQACFERGMLKSTYGTGCFVVMNTGAQALESDNRLLTTVGYRIDGQVTYALEGSIFVAGAAVQWLRDALRVVASAGDTEALARSLEGNDGVYMVPAFTGLGAPHWDPDARGAIYGLTRDTGIAHLVRATLESVCYQTADLFTAMRDDGIRPQALRVDGGMVANDWLCQFLSDVLALPVERPRQTETTALGAAYLAALGLGLYDSIEDVAAHWQAERRFEPVMPAAEREVLLAGWSEALLRTLSGRA